MPSDKKDFIDTIEAITTCATVISIRNKLSKVRARTEDQWLGDLLDTAIRRLDTSSSRALNSLDLAKPEYGKFHQYCKTRMGSTEPQWQILAERNGWIYGEGKRRAIFLRQREDSATPVLLSINRLSFSAFFVFPLSRFLTTHISRYP